MFSFGIVLCEILGRIPADPEVLPRTQVMISAAKSNGVFSMVPDCGFSLDQTDLYTCTCSHSGFSLEVFPWENLISEFSVHESSVHLQFQNFC